MEVYDITYSINYNINCDEKYLEILKDYIGIRPNNMEGTITIKLIIIKALLQFQNIILNGNELIIYE